MPLGADSDTDLNFLVLVASLASANCLSLVWLTFNGCWGYCDVSPWPSFSLVFWALVRL